MKNAVVYCRTSTENQKEEKTIELQVGALRKFAAQSQYEIVDWFKDDGVSGSLEHRPELLRMMKFLEEHQDVEFVLVYKLDRLSRDLYIQEGLIREFAKHEKILISSLEPDLAGSDPFRKAFRQMLGVFAEFEKAMITLRMKSGRDSSVAHGRWHGGDVYGYTSKGGKLVPNAAEAEVVRKIFYLKRSKRMKVSKIADYLNQSQIPTKRRTTKWWPSSVGKILNNKIYKGTMSYKGQFVLGDFQKIL